MLLNIKACVRHSARSWQMPDTKTRFATIYRQEFRQPVLRIQPSLASTDPVTYNLFYQESALTMR